MCRVCIVCAMCMRASMSCPVLGACACLPWCSVLVFMHVMFESLYNTREMTHRGAVLGQACLGWAPAGGQWPHARREHRAGSGHHPLCPHAYPTQALDPFSVDMGPCECWLSFREPGCVPCMSVRMKRQHARGAALQPPLSTIEQTNKDAGTCSSPQGRVFVDGAAAEGVMRGVITTALCAVCGRCTAVV